MADPESAPPANPRRTWLRQLLDRPDARPRVTRAVGSLLKVVVLSIGVLGALVIWHLVRRGRLIRDRLGPPRSGGLPEFGPDPGPVDPETDR
jgi:hypothetical protein